MPTRKEHMAAVIQSLRARLLSVVDIASILLRHVILGNDDGGAESLEQPLWIHSRSDHVARPSSLFMQ